MDKLVGLIKKAPKSRDYNDDDVIDRLSSRYTVVMLICFSLLVSMNQYVRNPITCMIPSSLKGNEKFATSFCWIRNTYYITWDTILEQAGRNSNKQTVAYYQWIPFVLVAQAVLFYLPSVIWHSLNSRSGVDADNILAAAHTFSLTDKVETRDRTMKMLVQQIHRFLKSHTVDHKKKRKKNCCGCKGRQCVGTRIGNYLVIIFIISKIFYLLNIFAQLYFLGRLMSTNFFQFGFHLFSQIIDKIDWTIEEEVVFPRETYCDINIIGLDAGNRQNFTLQCVLPVNAYNEKIYLFLWCWMMFLAVATSCCLLMWLLRSLCTADRERFVKNHVLDATGLKQEQKNLEQQPASKQPKSTYDTVVSQERSGKLSIEKLSNANDKSYTHGQPNPIRGADYIVLIASEDVHEFNRNIKRFCRKYLMQDGELLLRLIAHNTDHVTTTEVIYEVWKNWLDVEKSMDKKWSVSGESKREKKKGEEKLEKTNNTDAAGHLFKGFMKNKNNKNISNV
ncbi:hypothetical protein HELRODRAFT_106068 [Helobdella robusta]|uniref:Innexin n=1 Tax=Helobdella robusta TaxID=6412 RepID=T1EE00_HELRO|nr:hypothetical protein HELRODRAFT_106068 [Helobdella robusta]ESO06266.1 hypothetical protein HELRODRAFT_106068 [Helobdella robusta]